MNDFGGVLAFGGAPVPREAAVHLAGAKGRPDAWLWENGPLALAACAVNPSRNASPACARQGPLLSLFDGKLYDRRALASALRLDVATPDARLVLAAYERWGESSFSRLEGDFAVAIWDARSRHLTCAVDAMGGRSLFYSVQREFFAFATREDAFLGLPGVSGHPDEDLVAHLLVPRFLPEDGSHSWLRGVRSVCAGECMSVEADGRLRQHKHWNWQSVRPPAAPPESQTSQAFRQVFGAALRERAEGEHGLAMLLSGGMDSASIAAEAHEEGLPLGKAYSVLRDDPQGCVETGSIRALQSYLGSESVEVRVPSLEGADVGQLIADVWGGAHPRDNSMLVPLLLMRAAANAGDQSVLHGATGDVAQAAPDRYVSPLLRSGHWSSAWRECRLAAQHHTHLRGKSPLALLAANAWTAWAPRRLRWAMATASHQPAAIDPIVHPDFVRRARLHERLEEQDQARIRSRLIASTPQQDQAAALSGIYGPAAGLAGYQQLARRFRLQAFDPWGDRRVVSFLLGLPTSRKVCDGWTKSVPRQAFAPALPPEVVWRAGKEHLGDVTLRTVLEASKPFLDPLFASGLEPVRGFVDEARSRDVYARVRGNPTAKPADVDLVYHIASLAAWLGREPLRGSRLAA